MYDSKERPMNEDLLKDADAKLAQNEIELLGCYDVHPEPYENNPEAAEARRAFLDHLLAPFFARTRKLEAAAGHARLALAGYVSQQSAVNLLDAVLGERNAP
jgi:hypothetical protein